MALKNAVIVQNDNGTLTSIQIDSAATTTQAPVVIDASGNLGIGTSSPGAKLDVNGTGAVIQLKQNSTGAASYYVMDNTVETSGKRWRFGYTGAAGIPLFSLYNQTDNVLAWAADASGNLLVGTTSGSSMDGAKLYVLNSSNNAAVFRTDVAAFCSVMQTGNGSNTGQAVRFRFGASEVGAITATSVATIYNTTSDYRLKTVIGAVTNAGQRIDALQPVEYTWNASGEHTRGFLAHQFQEVYAGSVSGAKDAVDAEGKPVYQAMQASTSEVIADLVAEIQSLRARVTALESQA